MRSILAAALVLLCIGTAAAQEDDDDDDGDLGPPKVQANEDGRRAVRGTPVAHPPVDPARDALRQFELEAFSPETQAQPSTDTRPDWVKALKTGDVPVTWDARVIKFLEFYRDDPRGRAIMSGWLKAQGRYRDMIVKALRRHGLPEDLAYIAMIESSYDPLDVSRVGASGLWQFMPSAGHIYGLRQDYWLDERFDPEKSNEAQMLYFRDIYDRFGNWDLALASFNCGYGAVLKSMAKYGTNDFWALLDIEAGLPWESSVYVPKFLAAVVVGHNLAAFGFGNVTPDPPVEFDRVTVPGGVELATVARAAGADVKAVRALNPALKRGRTPPGGGDVTVRIPNGTKDRFAQTFPQLRSEWDSLDQYVLRHGERFEDVARTFGVSPARLREMNGVRDVTELVGGTLLVVPRIDPEARARNRALAEEDLYHSDVVAGGPDEPLLVPVKDKDLEVQGSRRVFYRVVSGDTLAEIAAAFNLPAADIAAWNGLDTDTELAARMVLMLFVPPDFDADKRNIALLDDARLMVVTAGSPEHLDVYEGRKGRVRQLVTVRAGETWDSIGSRYSLTRYDLARINRRGYTTPLKPGDELVVYKVVDRAKAKKTGVFKKTHVAARKAKAKTKAKATAPEKRKPQRKKG